MQIQQSPSDQTKKVLQRCEIPIHSRKSQILDHVATVIGQHTRADQSQLLI